ncbi:MAG: hypothetical protein LGB69_08075, partial [Sulfurovum sp.]|nr:hypothetical protein [Sulfurovum sp.]
MQNLDLTKKKNQFALPYPPLMVSFYWLCVRVDHMVKMPKRRVGVESSAKKKTEMSNEKTKGEKENKK